jgi:hypothetical protein
MLQRTLRAFPTIGPARMAAIALPIALAAASAHAQQLDSGTPPS